MTERSQPWDGTTLGDASRARYDSDEWIDMYQHLFGSLANCGVIAGIYRELWVHEDAANTAEVEQGAALVYGRWYNNDVSFTINVPSATAGNWREDAVVLRCSWAAQTIRAVLKTNPSGENTVWDNDTMLTQTDGTTWEIPLAAVRVDDAGDLTVTDLRQYVFGPRVDRYFGDGEFTDHGSAPDWLVGWQFDPSSVEQLHFSWVVPDNFRGYCFRIYVYFTGAATGAGTGVVWEVYGTHVEDGGIVSGATWSLRDEGQVVAAGSRLTILELTDDTLTGNSPDDVVEPGEYLDMTVRRLATDGGDDYPNDAQLLGIKFEVA